MAQGRNSASKKIQDLSKDTGKSIKSLQADIEDLFKSFGKLTDQQKKDLADVIANSRKLQDAMKKVKDINVTYKDDLEDVLDIIKDINKTYQVSDTLSEKINKVLKKQIDKLDKQKNIKDKIEKFDKKTLDTLSKNDVLLDGSLSKISSRLREIAGLQAEIDINPKSLVDESIVEKMKALGLESKQLTEITNLQNNLLNKRNEILANEEAQQQIISQGYQASSVIAQNINDLKEEEVKLEKALELGISRRSASLKRQLKGHQESLNLAGSELKRRQKINDAFEEYKNQIDESYTMYASMASLIPGIGKSLSESFLQAKTISINALQQVRDVMYETNDPIQALQAGWSTLTQGVGRFGAVLGIILIALQAVHSLFSAINESTTSIQRETGLASDQAYTLYKNALDAQTTFSNQLSTLEDILAVQSAMVNTYGRFTELSGEVVTQISDAAKVFGYSADTAGQLQATFMELGADESLAGNLQVVVGNLAKANNIAPGIIAKDLIDNAEYVSTVFAGMPKEAAKAAIEVRKLGFSLQNASKVSSHLFDIQGSLTSAMEASVGLGRLIDTNAARRFAIEGKTADMMREVAKQAGTYSEFTQMSVSQRMLLADAFGLEVKDLTKSLYIREKLSDLSEEELANAQKYLKDLENVESMDKAQLKAEISKAQQAEKFNVAMSKIKNAFISAILPAAEALLPLIETFSHIMSGIAPIIKFIGLAFKLLGAVIEGALAPFSFINDIINQDLNTAISNFKDRFLSDWKGVTKLIVGTALAVGFVWKGVFSGIIKGAAGIGSSLKSAFSPDTYQNFFKGFSSFKEKVFGKSYKGGQFMPGGKRAPAGGQRSGGLRDKFSSMFSNNKQSSNKGSKGAGMLSNLGDSIKAIPAKKLLKLGAAFTIFAAGVFVLAKGLQQFETVQWESLGKAGVAIIGLSVAAAILGKVKGQMIQGAIAVGILGAALIPFAFAMNLIAGVNIKAILSAAAGLAIFTIAVFALGALITSGVGAVLFGAGILGMLALGAALIVLGAGMYIVAKAAEKFASALTVISSIDTSTFKSITEDIPKFIDAFDGIESIASPIHALAFSMHSLAESLTKLASIPYNKISEGLQTVSESDSQKPNFSILDGIKSFTGIKAERPKSGMGEISTPTNTPAQQASNNTGNSFDQRNSALGGSNTAALLARLVSLLETNMGNPPKLVLEFGDGTMRELNSRLKKTL